MYLERQLDQPIRMSVRLTKTVLVGYYCCCRDGGVAHLQVAG